MARERDTIMVAKKLFTIRDKYSTTITYEYRGHEYDVEYSNCWTYCVTPAKVQHQDEQRRIDRLIEQEAQVKEVKPFDLDEIFSFFE